MNGNRDYRRASGSMDRRSFLGTATAATLAVGVEPQGEPTSTLLDRRLQTLVGLQGGGIVIHAKTSRFDNFVLLHQQKVIRDCEVSVRSSPDGYEVVVLGESGSLRSLPRLGFELQDERLFGMNLDRYGCSAESPDGVMAVCARLFESLSNTRREAAPRPAVIDWPLVRLCELVKDWFPDLDMWGSGPFGRLDVSLADGGLRVERDGSDQGMTLHVWVDAWQGLLLPEFAGFGGLRRYVESALLNMAGISLAPTGELTGILTELRALLELLDAISAVEAITISVAPDFDQID